MDDSAVRRDPAARPALVRLARDYRAGAFSRDAFLDRVLALGVPVARDGYLQALTELAEHEPASEGRFADRAGAARAQAELEQLVDDLLAEEARRSGGAA